MSVPIKLTHVFNLDVLGRGIEQENILVGWGKGSNASPYYGNDIPAKSLVEIARGSRTDRYTVMESVEEIEAQIISQMRRIYQP